MTSPAKIPYLFVSQDILSREGKVLKNIPVRTVRLSFLENMRKESNLEHMPLEQFAVMRMPLLYKSAVWKYEYIYKTEEEARIDGSDPNRHVMKKFDR